MAYNQETHCKELELNIWPNNRLRLRMAQDGWWFEMRKDENGQHYTVHVRRLKK